MSAPAGAPSPNDPGYEAYLAEYSGQPLVAVGILFIVLNLTFAILRLISQRVTNRKFGLEDFFSYAGLPFILGECAIGVFMPAVCGVGRHVIYLAQFEPEKLQREYIIMYPLAIIYISAFTFPKLAILFLYLRVFNTKTTRAITWVLVGVVTATWIAETLTGIFRCWPIQFVWDKTIQGTCVNQNAMFQFWSVPNIVTDLVMLVLPMPTVWKLYINLTQKLALTFTFLLGSLGLVAAIVRFVIFSQTSALEDATWASVPLQIWTIVEPSMYFIAGVLPTLRGLAALFWNKMRTGVSGGSQDSNPKKYISKPSAPRSLPSEKHDSGLYSKGYKVRTNDTEAADRDYMDRPWLKLDDDPLRESDMSAAEQGIRRTQQVTVSHERR